MARSEFLKRGKYCLKKPISYRPSHTCRLNSGGDQNLLRASLGLAGTLAQWGKCSDQQPRTSSFKPLSN